MSRSTSLLSASICNTATKNVHFRTDVSNVFLSERFCRRQTSFRCLTCRAIISNTALGTLHRNHCPLCLWSRHVDITPGDRKSTCGGRMKPIGLRFKLDGELMIVHRCLSCGKLSNNRISGDDIPEILLMLIAEHNNTMNLLTKEHLPAIHDALYGKCV